MKNSDEVWQYGIFGGNFYIKRQEFNIVVLPFENTLNIAGWVCTIEEYERWVLNVDVKTLGSTLWKITLILYLILWLLTVIVKMMMNCTAINDNVKRLTQW